jgi:hypothetical protein
MQAIQSPVTLQTAVSRGRTTGRGVSTASPFRYCGHEVTDSIVIISSFCTGRPALITYSSWLATFDLLAAGLRRPLEAGDPFAASQSGSTGPSILETALRPVCRGYHIRLWDQHRSYAHDTMIYSASPPHRVSVDARCSSSTRACQWRSLPVITTSSSSRIMLNVSG